MNHQSEPFDANKQLGVALAIHGVMIGGVVLMAVLLLLFTGLPPTPELSRLRVEWFGIALAAVNIGLALTVFSNSGRSTGQPQPGESAEAAAFRDWQTASLIRFALLEGAALVNVIFATFLGGGWFNLAPAMACLAVMMFLFPSRYGWECHRNRSLGF
jgi:hypothetical protein